MDLGLQIWYTKYVGVQMGTAFGGSHFLSLMFLIERFQICLYRIRKIGFLHALNRALQCQQAMDAGGWVDLLNFQPRGFGSDLPQSFRGFNSHLNQLHNGAPGMGNQPIPGEVLFFAGSENRQSTIPAVDY